MKKLLFFTLLIACISMLLAQTTPVNLTGTLSGENIVLNWNTPTITLAHFSGNMTGSSGVPNETLVAAARFPESYLADLGVQGMKLAMFSYLPRHSATGQNTVFTPMVWTGVTGLTNPGTPAYTHTTFTLNASSQSLVWQDVIPTTDVIIPETGDLWLGYSYISNAGHPACYDGNAIAANNNLNLLNYQGQWYPLHQVLGEPSFENWMIRGTAAYPTDFSSAPIPFSNAQIYDDSTDSNIFSETLTSSNSLINIVSQEEIDKYNRLYNSRSLVLNGYKVFYGFDLETATELTTGYLNTPTYTYTSAANDSYHYFHVIAYYNVDTVDEFISQPASIRVIKGSPTITNFPWYEDFDTQYNSVLASDIPPLWSQINVVSGTGTTDFNRWHRKFTNAIDSHSNWGSFSSSGQEIANNYFITPKIQLPDTIPAGHRANLSFWIRNWDHLRGVETYSVKLSTGANTPRDAFTNNLLTETLPEHSSWISKNIDITDWVGEGAFYIAFAHSSVNQWYICLDDVRIDIVDETHFDFLPPTGLSGTPSTTSVNLTWSAPASATPNLTGYNVYQDDRFVGFSNTTSITDYQPFNGDFDYQVVAVYEMPNGISTPITTTVTVTGGVDVYLSPANLTVNTVEVGPNNHTANLTWTVPEVTSKTVSQTHLTEIDDYHGGIIFTSTKSYVMHRFTLSHLLSQNMRGKYINSFTFIPYALVGNENIKYVFSVFKNGGLVGDINDPEGYVLNAGELIYEQEIDQSGLKNSTPITIMLNKLVQIPQNQELWFGMYIEVTNRDVTDNTGMVIGTDRGSNVPDTWGYAKVGLGNILSSNGDTWDVLLHPADYEANQGRYFLDANWAMSISFIDAVAAGDQVAEYQVLPTRRFSNDYNDVKVFENNSFATSLFRNSNIIQRPANITLPTFRYLLNTGYNVYAGFEDAALVIQNSTPVLTTNYSMTELIEGIWNIAVKAIYPGGESLAAENMFLAGDLLLLPEDMPIIEGFETVAFPPLGWTIIDVDGDGYNWFRTNSPELARTGNACVSSASWLNTGGAGTPLNSNNYLVTPKIQLPENFTNWDISFWYKNRDADYSEFIDIRISTTGKSPSDFSIPFISTPIEAWTMGQWTQFSRSLAYNSTIASQIEGQEIFIAIISTSDDQFILDIDDIHIGPPPLSTTDDPTMPLKTNLRGNYPNPFNPQTNISFYLDKAQKTTLEIFNIKGQKIKTLVNDNLNLGYHNIIWNGDDNSGNAVSSGIYLYRLKTEGFTQTNKMLMLK